MINISRGQIIGILGVVILGIALALPNALNKDFVSKIPSWLPNQTFNLGLDLQGGAHLLYEVDMTPVYKTALEDVRKAIRNQFRSSENRIRYVSLRVNKDSVTFRLPQAEQREKALSALRQVLSDIGGTGNALTGAAARYEYTISGDGRGEMKLTEAGRRHLLDRTIGQSIAVIRRRVDETGTKEPIIQRQGLDRILVQVPGERDPQKLKERVGTVAKMTFHLVNDGAGIPPGQPAPRGSVWLPHAEQGRQPVLVFEDVALDGSHLVDASQTFNEGQVVVSFRFDTTGARIFCKITQENLRKRFATVLDGKVLTAPVIQSQICGGSGIITGNFTVQSASQLALLIRAGALPAPLKVVEERTVGPGLGQDSIDAGKIASVIGLVLVVVFMFMAYGRFGLMADVALLVNLCLIAAAMSLLQATLTLPGIAGIVLTIGMAVDANVLIFERIREEIRAGRTPMSAIDTGYRRALTTIIDSNLTTFIAALLLFLFGSGPVKGFGVTLAIGLATSMFSAIMVTRLLVVLWWRRKRPETLPI